MNNSTYEILRGNALVDGFSSTQLESFNNEGERISVNSGDILLHQGDSGKYLYLVLNGKLEVYFPSGSERFTAITLAIRNSGDYFGEYAFIDADPVSASVKATQPSELFMITHDSVYLLFKSDPDMGRMVYRNLLINLVKRLRRTDKELDFFHPIS